MLAAAAVLQYLAGMARGWAAPGGQMRFGLAAGFLVFIGVAAAQLAGRSLLEFPPSWAGSLIVLIEASLVRGRWDMVIVVLAGGFLAAPYVFRVLQQAFLVTQGGAALRVDRRLFGVES